MSRRPPPPSTPRPTSTRISKVEKSISFPINSPNSTASNKIPEYFSESKLPSCRSGFYKPHEERITRRRTCRFLEEASRVLKLPRVAISTSMVFFHRFYAVHSFETHDRFEVAVACILLAAKTEESPKKLISVIQECFRLKNLSAKRKTLLPGTSNSIDGKTSVDQQGFLDIKCEEFVRLKEKILLLERVILHTIGFELSIDHPYKYLVEQIKKMVPSRQLQCINPNQGSKQENIMNNLVQNAMNFANDSMHTSLCLQFPSKTIAHACCYMSGSYCKMRPTDDKHWLDILDIQMDELASIALQLMELIADKKGVDRSDFAPIEADIEEMKKLMESQLCNTSGKSSAKPTNFEERDPKRPRL